MKYFRSRSDYAACRQGSSMTSDIRALDCSLEDSMQLATLGIGPTDGKSAAEVLLLRAAGAAAAVGSSPPPPTLPPQSAASSYVGFAERRSPAAAAASSADDGRPMACFGCGMPVRDEHVLRVEPDMSWHATCLRCHACRRLLDETCTCFVKGGRIYCKPDYHRLFAVKCAACGSSFNKDEFVMKAMHALYHVVCFRCVACNKQLMPGDEFTVRQSGLLCKADRDAEVLTVGAAAVAEAMTSASCCRQQQHQQRHQHAESAMSCSSDSFDSCSGDGGSGSHVKGDATRQSRHATGKNCELLGLAQPAVAAASAASSAQVRCKPDVVAATTVANGYHHNHHHGAGGGRHGSSTVAAAAVTTAAAAAALSQPSRPPHQAHKDGSCSGGGVGVAISKTTRVRTVLNEKQLHMLRACYAANPRPDALMKEQLVDMTGLSPRVIRVWFQNKRCKDKKKSILMKQLQQQQQQQQLQKQQQQQQQQQKQQQQVACAGPGSAEKAGSAYDSAGEEATYLADDDAYVPQGSAASSQYSGTSDSPLSNG